LYIPKILKIFQKGVDKSFLVLYTNIAVAKKKGSPTLIIKY